MNKIIIVLAAALLTLPIASRHSFSQGFAQEIAQADANIGTAEGEVRKIDKATKKVTVRHGPVAGLDMEAMTMVLQVADPADLDKLNVGDKIRFTVRRGGGAFTLQSFETIK